MSLRKLSTLAGVSLPYLSQIERGLRRPSAEIMQAIAKALRISANTMYVQAGILDEHPKPDVHAAVMGDTGLTERQKQALLAVYASFRDETSRRRATRKGLSQEGAPADADAAAEALLDATIKAAAKRPAAKRSTKTATTHSVRPGTGASRSQSTARSTSSGRSETQAEAKPSPGSPSASRSPSFDSSKGGAKQ
jgi:hypothetical protein